MRFSWSEYITQTNQGIKQKGRTVQIKKENGSEENFHQQTKTVSDYYNYIVSGRSFDLPSTYFVTESCYKNGNYVGCMMRDERQ